MMMLHLAHSIWSIPSINIKVNIQFWQNDNLNGVLTKVFHCWSCGKNMTFWFYASFLDVFSNLGWHLEEYMDYVLSLNVASNVSLNFKRMCWKFQSIFSLICVLNLVEKSRNMKLNIAVRYLKSAKLADWTIFILLLSWNQQTKKLIS